MLFNKITLTNYLLKSVVCTSLRFLGVGGSKVSVWLELEGELSI